MSTTGKSEINLEISAGFFRIATETVVYNITVLEDRPPWAPRATPEFLSDTGSRPVELTASRPIPIPISEAPDPDFAAPPVGPCGEDFYKQVSNEIFNDIGKLAKSLSMTMGDIPAEDRRLRRVDLDEAGEKIENAKAQLQDIVSMTEKATMEIMDKVEKVQSQTDGVKELLLMLKNHSAFQAASEIEEEEGGDQPAPEELLAADPSEAFAALRQKIADADALCAALREEGGAQAPAAAEEPTPPVLVSRTRYLFSIDTALQTMYELCTNETVKTHITAARKKEDELFDRDVFVDTMGEKIADLSPDGDNFFTVPLSDVLSALLLACSDPKIKNLFKKMDLNQKEIFLDQSLPLEVPPSEEVQVAAAAPVEMVESGSAPLPPDDPRFAELGAMLGDSLGLIDELERGGLPAGPSRACMTSGMSLAHQQEIFAKIEDAFQVVSGITDDVSRINEALIFQDLSGQQILKIIKLLSDFQVQLLAIVVSFGSQLKMKEQNAEITVEESKRCAQEDVDRYLKSMTTEEVNGKGTLDQDAVNSLLADLGF